MDTYMDTKPERRFLLIGWLMGVEQNSVYLSRILVVGCVGLFDCEELLGVILTGDEGVRLPFVLLDQLLDHKISHEYDQQVHEITCDSA